MALRGEGSNTQMNSSNGWYITAFLEEDAYWGVLMWRFSSERNDIDSRAKNIPFSLDFNAELSCFCNCKERQFRSEQKSFQSFPRIHTMKWEPWQIEHIYTNVSLDFQGWSRASESSFFNISKQILVLYIAICGYIQQYKKKKTRGKMSNQLVQPTKKTTKSFSENKTRNIRHRILS